MKGMIIGLLLIFSLGTFAQKIYTWKDEFGTVHFTTTPPVTQAVKEAELGQEAASGLGGNIPAGTEFLSNGNQGGSTRSGLTYSEKQDIKRLETRAQRQGIANNLKNSMREKLPELRKDAPTFYLRKRKPYVRNILIF